MQSAARSPPLLVLGATALAGRALLRRLHGRPVIAVVRRPPARHDPDSGVVWQAADLYAQGPRAEAARAVLSAGPLDGLVAWLERQAPALERIIALSSTSVHVKTGSADPSERRLAEVLATSEARLADWCHAHAVGYTILRPTLIYDDADPGALAVYVRIARRLGCVPLPDDATGLRQPVHADDVAKAMLACLDRVQTAGQGYDLPGGETLGYRRLVARTLAHAGVPGRLIAVPRRMLVVGLGLAHRLGRLRAYSPQMLARMAEDLCFDAGPARRDFAYVPRAYPGR